MGMDVQALTKYFQACHSDREEAISSSSSRSHSIVSKYGYDGALNKRGFLKYYSDTYVENDVQFLHDLTQLGFFNARRLSALPPAQHTALWLAHLLAAIAGVWILCYVVYHRCNPRKAAHGPTGTT